MDKPEKCLICGSEVSSSLKMNENAVKYSIFLEELRGVFLNGDSELLQGSQRFGVKLKFCKICKSNLAGAREANKELRKAQKTVDELQQKLSWELKTLQIKTDCTILQMERIATSAMSRSSVPNHQTLEVSLIHKGIDETSAKLMQLKQALCKSVESLSDLQNLKKNFNQFNFEGVDIAEDCKDESMTTPVVSEIPVGGLNGNVDNKNESNIQMKNCTSDEGKSDVLSNFESSSFDSESPSTSESSDEEEVANPEPVIESARMKSISLELCEAVKTFDIPKISEIAKRDEEAYQKLIKAGLNFNFNETSTEVAELIKELHCVPLAIQLALTYIKTQKIVVKSYSISDYLNELAKKSKKVNNSNWTLNVIIMSAINKVLQVSIMKIQDSYEQDIGDVAVFILDTATYINAENINQELFYSFLDKRDVNRAVDILLQYGLVCCKSESKSVFSVEPVIQEINQLQLRNNGDEKKALGTTLHMLLEKENVAAIPQERIFHILTVWEHIWKHGDLVRETSEEAVNFLWNLMKIGKYEEGIRFGEEALKKFNGVIEENHLNFCRIEFYIAQINTRQGSANKSILKLKNLLQKLQNSCVKEDNGFALAIKTELGGALRLTGKPEEALTLQREVISKKKLIFGDTHPETISAETTLGLTLVEIGQYESALKIFEKALSVHVSSDNSQLEAKEASRIMTYIGNVYIQTGDHEKAIVQLGRAYKLLSPVWTEDLELFLMICCNVGQIFIHLQNYKEALKILVENEEKIKQRLGSEHPGVKELMKLILFIRTKL